MPYIIAQNLLYLLLAMLLGALIAWLFGLCRCNSDEILTELDGARAERDALAERLAKTGNLNASVTNGVTTGDNSADGAKLISLQAQLDAANAKIAEFEAKSNDSALGLAGSAALGAAGAGLALKANETAIDSEELEALKARNKFLETRIKFFEDAPKTETSNVVALKTNETAINAEELEALKARNKFLETRNQFLEAAPKVEAPVSKNDFTPSAAVNMTSEELEDLVIAAGDGQKPKAIMRGNDADDLLLIEGVGPKNYRWLNENGIHYFWQIATMTPPELAWIANNLPKFGTRVYRENWVKQAANLAKGLPPRG